MKKQLNFLRFPGQFSRKFFDLSPAAYLYFTACCICSSVSQQIQNSMLKTYFIDELKFPILITHLQCLFLQPEIYIIKMLCPAMKKYKNRKYKSLQYYTESRFCGSLILHACQKLLKHCLPFLNIKCGHTCTNISKNDTLSKRAFVGKCSE